MAVDARIREQTKLATKQVTEEDAVSLKHGDGWNVVEKRRRPKNENNPAIHGTCISNNSLRAAPRKAFLYVARFDPSTKPEQVLELLKKDFPEATCETLPSKYPEHYASFKVTVYLQNLQNAMKPDIWPYGIYISRFFHRRSTYTKPT